MTAASPPDSLPLVLALILAGAHLAWAAVDLARPRPAPVTYVFTPFIGVQPDSVVLSAAEGVAVAEAVDHRVDARQISQAYARMGSTMSLAGLLGGVEALLRDGQLRPDQQRRIEEILTRARGDHAELIEVQRQILDLELRVSQRVQGLRARVAR